MVIILIIIFFQVSLISSAYAKECDCNNPEILKFIDKIYTPVESLKRDLSPTPFWLPPILIENAKNFALYKKLEKAGCLKNKNIMSIKLSSTSFRDVSRSVDKMSFSQTSDYLNPLLDQNELKAYEDCLKNKFYNDLSKYPECEGLSAKVALDKLEATKASPEETIRQLSKGGNFLSPDDKADLYAKNFYYNKVLKDSPDKLKQSLRDFSKKHDERTKVKLLQNILFSLNNNYDYDRANAKKGHTGKINFSDLVYGLQNGKKVGICGDISLGGAAIAKELGFKNIYVIGSDVDAISHAQLIFMGEKNQTYRFNYSQGWSLKEGHNRDALLGQNANDITALYRVFNSDGKMVKKIPSELYKMLSDASGIDYQQIFPIGTHNYSLTSLKVQLHDNVFVTPFSGYDSEGRIVFGAALGVDIFKNIMSSGTYHHLRVSTSYARRSSLAKNAKYSNLEGSVDSNFILSQLEYLLKSPSAKLTKELKIKAGLLANIILHAANNEYSKESDKRFNPQAGDFHVSVHAFLKPSLELIFGDENSSVQGKIEASAVVTHGRDDLGVVNSESYWIPKLQNIAVSGELSARVGARAYLVALATLLMNTSVGEQIVKAGIGYKDPNVSVMFDITANLGDSPQMEEQDNMQLSSSFKLGKKSPLSAFINIGHKFLPKNLSDQILLQSGIKGHF